MACEHGECGCNHDHGVDTEERQAETHDVSAGCCGGHPDPETETDDQFKVGQGT